MPYFNFYESFADYDEEADDGNEPKSSGSFKYESASCPFKREGLPGVAAVALQLIRAAGIAEMRVRYDGGNDEGFAHADDVWIGGVRKPQEHLLDLLTNPSNVEAIRSAAADPESSQWHNAIKFYRNAEPRKVIAHAVDELAHEIASQLLGSGYGTGEYELYGALVINFESERIVDDPDCPSP